MYFFFLSIFIFIKIIKKEMFFLYMIVNDFFVKY